MSKVSFLGAGSWGTALAIMLAQNGHDVTLWSKVQAEVDMLQQHREHIHRLPGVKLPDSIVVTSDLKQACEGNDLIVFSVASPFVRATAKEAAVYIPEGQRVVNVAKGIEEDTLMTLCDIIKQEIPCAEVAVLSGPSHAEEVSIGMPTTVVVGAKTKEFACYLQEVFMNDRFRVYTSSDMIGIELGGSIKNVIALAAGVSVGLGCGDNTMAALITRGITEIARLGIAMGGRLETFAGLSGIGDLIVTCTSMHSRNRRAGILIGEGKSAQEAMTEIGAVVEGYYAAESIHQLAEREGVEMPICRSIYEVLYHGRAVQDVVSSLMCRAKKDELTETTWL